MSWDSWVTKLEDGNICEYAGIFGRQGGAWAVSTKANSSGFAFPETELVNFSGIMEREDKSICVNGAVLNGIKFFVTHVEKEKMILQGKQDHKEWSLVVCASATALIIGFNGQAGVKTNQVCSVVESIKDYFKTIGY